MEAGGGVFTLVILLTTLTSCGRFDAPEAAARRFLTDVSSGMSGYIDDPRPLARVLGRRHNLYSGGPFTVGAARDLGAGLCAVPVWRLSMEGVCEPDRACWLHLVHTPAGWKVDLSATLADPTLSRQDRDRRKRDERRLKNALRLARRGVQTYRDQHGDWPANLAAVVGATPYPIPVNVGPWSIALQRQGSDEPSLLLTNRHGDEAPRRIRLNGRIDPGPPADAVVPAVVAP